MFLTHKYIKIIYILFIFKKLFLILSYQKRYENIKKFNFKQKKLIFLKNMVSTVSRNIRSLYVFRMNK
jgi:hypothetical protein